MRNFIVLGASALLLALGVAQASAVQSTGQPGAEHVARTSAQPAYTGEWRDGRKQPIDRDAAHASDQPLSSVSHHIGREPVASRAGRRRSARGLSVHGQFSNRRFDKRRVRPPYQAGRLEREQTDRMRAGGPG